MKQTVNATGQADRALGPGNLSGHPNGPEHLAQGRFADEPVLAKPLLPQGEATHRGVRGITIGLPKTVCPYGCIFLAGHGL